ncbi:regulator [Nocardia sp. 2]|uniref:Regulator n=1 Tax=Nocardia acididurans TaxID=2802282 RepID=A0ABS1MHG1_9NOCA|nr:regulator [Nocardia acididurans]MBL1080098.1 regulator [Nocardia acididurans]
MSIERRIEELTAQAADAGLMDDFLAGKLVRSTDQTDVSGLPVPDAAEVESAGAMVPTTVRFSPAQKEKLAALAKARGTDVSSLVREWVDHQLEAFEHPERQLITVDEAIQALRNLPHSA